MFSVWYCAWAWHMDKESKQELLQAILTVTVGTSRQLFSCTSYSPVDTQGENVNYLRGVSKA